MKKSLTLSIVIPVYNEERHLKACLDAIASQSRKPDEVIVVNNNSTDGTAEIAASYKFVKLIDETKQGRGNARTAGFNAAKSDIIGRIDADSVIAPDWAERLLNDFEEDRVAAVTGLGLTGIITFLPRPCSTFWSRIYFWSAHAYFNTITVWGANSGFRRSAWLDVKDDVCNDDRKVHEDIDLSLLIAGHGGKIIQDNRLLIKTDGLTYMYLPKLTYYGILRRRTKRLHINKGTLNSTRAKAQLIGPWNTLPGRLLTIVPGIVFICLSILTLPLEAAVLVYRRQSGKNRVK